MKKVFCFAGIALSLFASGCAIHPVPENVTGVSTYHIVRQIRCEARAAVISSAINGFKNSGDPEIRQIGLEFEDGTRPIASLSYKLFRNPRFSAIVKLFFDTGIAYNFSLEMTENNDLGTEINLLKPFTDSKVTLGISAGFNRQRMNTRAFTVTDTFGHLIRDVKDDYCEKFMVTENYIYPIAGRIGIEDMIHDFINLTLFGNLAGPNDKGPPTLVDALEFETTITGSATPKVVFSPVGNGLSVTDASLTGTVKRNDLHKVTVGLAIDDGSVAQVAPLRNELFGRLLTASGGRAELKAAEAVNQVLTSKLFNRTVIVPR